MHLLVVATSFPSPANPFPGSFIAQQVRGLAEQVERVTVLCPVPRAPFFLARFHRFAPKASLPQRYSLVEGRCEVLFPRYLKAPGDMFLSWTTRQWCRLVDKTITRLAETCPVSIVHAHSGSVSSWAAIQAARRHKIPCVVTYHGSEVHTRFARRQKGWRLCRDSFRYADLNLPVSTVLTKILTESIHPMGRCETMLLGVDRSRFYPANDLAQEPRVLFVGRVEEAKGAYDLVQAWARVLVHHSQARLTMVGEDRTKGSFLKQARALGIDHSINLPGPLPGPEVAALMRASRIFCLPSHREGTPVSVMEALSCALPVVATRVGGIPDIISEGTTGLLVEKGDTEGLASALIDLLGDSSRCIRMGKEAQDFARIHLDIRQTADRLVKLYREIIAVHSADRGSCVVGKKNRLFPSQGVDISSSGMGAL